MKPSSTFMLGMGKANLLDTYLSALEYKGLHVDLMHEYRRTLDWNDNRGSFRSTFHASGTEGKIWGGSADLWSGDLNYDAVWQYSILGSDGTALCLKLGGGVGATVGGTYATRGGNNPAQAHLQMRLLGSFTASYKFWNLYLQKKKMLVLRYHADLPLLGGMFSPAYGQSYYEIFSKGNYDHNVVLTHPVNSFCVRQQLSADISFSEKSKYALRVGYLCDIRQAKPNQLKQHVFSNSLMVGFVKYLK